MKEQIIKLRKEGKTYQEISDIVGCAKSTINYNLNPGQRIKTNKRNKKNKTDKCSCGNVKMKKSKKCQTCANKLKKENLLNKSIEETSHSNGTGHKFTYIRQVARNFKIKEGKPKLCSICGFKHHVEVCHIKAISSFSTDTKISVVNNLNNLIYLCPNHHYMFDHDLIDITGKECDS